MLQRLAPIALVACTTTAELPEPPLPPDKSDGFESMLTCSYLHRDIAAIPPRFDTIAATELAGLRPLDGAPAPTIGHDADGFFHPRRELIHSARLALATDTVGDYLDALGFDSSGFRAGNAVGIPTPYLEGGTFASDAPAPHDPATSVRVGVWNIARGANLETVIEQIVRMGADIWVINEGDLYGRSSKGRVAAREIARALGFDYVASGEFYELRDDRRGLSGNAIVSRYPLSDIQTLYLPMFGGRDWAKRNALDPQPRCGQRSAISARATIALTDGTTRTVNMISAHLENSAQPGTREQQLRVVREFLAVPGEPTVIGGDFNTLGIGEGGDLRSDLATAARGTTACATDPSGEACADATEKGFPYTFADCSNGDDTATFLLSRIDWILAQHASCSGYRVATEASGSDHKPVLTELAVR